MLTDALAFGLLIYTASVAKMPSTTRYTYGFKRAEVLGAVLSTLLIWMLTAMLVYEAGWRMAAYREGSMEDVDGRVMFGVAVLGVAACATPLAPTPSRHSASSPRPAATP